LANANPDTPTSPGARAVSFGAVADSHYADKTLGDRHCRDSAAKLRHSIRTLNEHRLGLAFHLGDTVDTGSSKDEEAGYVRSISEICSGFRGSFRVVLGNHDVQTLSKREFANAWGAGAEPGGYGAFTAEGFRFVVLDSNCHEDGSDFCAGDFDWRNAWVAETQLRWLEHELARVRAIPVVVLCHGNLDHRLTAAGEPDPHVLRNAAAVRCILERAGNVCAVVQGHCHSGAAAVQNGIPYLTLTAMVTGPGLENNAFAVVTVTTHRTVRVKGFGRQPELTLGPGH